MRSKALVLGLLVVVALSATVWAFDAYFSDAAGNKLGQIQEGQQVYIAVNDPDKGACGIDEFQADLVIFDFKTGAYINRRNVTFREVAGIGTGIYFWVTGPGSSTKVIVPVGTRASFTNVPRGQTHVLQPGGVGLWDEGAWMYVDEDVLGNHAGNASTGFAAYPQGRLTSRVDFEGLPAGANVQPGQIAGRLENMDTLIVIVADGTDDRNIDQDQAKIIDTTAKISINPSQLSYACGAHCGDIVVRIEDPDENLDSSQVEYVPFFVIVNPGSWNPAHSRINNFCSLMERGSYAVGGDLDRPIRWYNAYSEPVTAGGVASRFIEYPVEWLNGTYAIGGNPVGRVLFFAAETAADSGVFEFNFGNLSQFQQLLGFNRFSAGTTIVFYYVDPNDADDMDLAAAEVADRSHSEVYLTDDAGSPVDQVELGGGLYVRVYDGDANVNACCQDKVVVHICDVHGEDDSEYWAIDEVSNDSGIFASQNGMPLLPVWDAVGGYQLVIDDWKFEAFNEDTIYVRYNSVDYREADINLLADGNANDGRFPPRIDENSVRSQRQKWDVSFDKVKVYDTQVFDGSTHYMHLLNGNYEPVDEIPEGGSLYLEVIDPDQNENPLLREEIFGGWNKDMSSADDTGRTVTYVGGYPDPTTLGPSAGEDSAPIWWRDIPGGQGGGGQNPPPPPGGGGGQNPPPPPPRGDSDIMTPGGAVADDPATPYIDPYLGGPQAYVRGNDDVSITGIPETVKVFLWDAQNGNWERMDLKETGVDTGVFRSTTCVAVADSRNPGDGNLGAAPGDTIMAFYQDPSNHSDISIVSIKVSEGGASAVTPPTQPTVAFGASQYKPGDTVIITVTDPAYAGQPAIDGGANVILELKDASGNTLQSWTRIEAVSGSTNQFQVAYTLAGDILGTITAIYTDPATPTRTAQAQAQVVAAELEKVTGVVPQPQVFSDSTTFQIQAEPAGALAEEIEITIYDLTGKAVAELSGSDTDSVTWDGGSLRNGAYIFVALVKGAGQSWTFRGFVYISR